MEKLQAAKRRIESETAYDSLLFSLCPKGTGEQGPRVFYQIGGHVGFDVRPSKRGKGHGNEILKLALEKAKQVDLNRVLVTCDERNEASRKIVEHNGGVFENRIINDKKGFEGFPALRYWINMK